MKNSFFIILFLLSLFKLYAQSIPLIELSIKNQSVNDPAQAQPYFSYNSYQNLKVSGDPEAITGPGYKKTELRKTLTKTQVYYQEKLSLILHDSIYGNKEIIQELNVPGFKQPVYPIYTIIFQSKNAYADPYIIYDQEFINPLSNRGLDYYNYETVMDTAISNRAVTKVVVTKKDAKNKNLVDANLFLDSQTGAIAYAKFETKGTIDVQAVHTYYFESSFDLWINNTASLFIKNKKTLKEFELFGGRLAVGNEKDLSNKNDLNVSVTTVNSNFSNTKIDYGKRGMEIDATNAGYNNDESIWKPYRDQELFSTNELAKLVNLDSLVTESNITRKLDALEKFKFGYVSAGLFDFDLKYLIKYNNYEALRTGLGGVTNSKFSDDWSLGGYLVYGTKDAAFKYKANIGYRLNEEQNTWINIFKADDLNELAAATYLTDGRVYSLFEPRLINIPTYYLYKEYGISVQQRPFSRLLGEASLSRKRIVQTTSYIYAPDGELFDNYVLTELTAGLRWSPETTYMRSPKGYQEIKAGYPILSAQVTQGIKGVAESDFNYFKLSSKAEYAITNKDKSSTELSLEGHYSRGNVPLTHLFHAYPNAPNKDEILQRFSVAGRGSFETMFFNEFFSDRIAIFQAKHRFAPLRIASFLKPEIVLLTKAAIGNLKDKDDHLNIPFSTLEKGYMESGFEINQLLFGFGISGAYRYGPYHLPNFGDNISLKFTFYLQL